MILARKCISGRFDEFDFVVARNEIRECVVTRIAVGVVGSNCCCDEAAVTFVEIDGNAIQTTGSAIVLLAIIVAIDPHVIAEAGQFVNAGIDSLVGFAGAQGHNMAQACYLTSIAICCIVCIAAGIGSC